jgi:FkbH-like protein
MTSKIESFHKFNIPRVSQLTIRSNQFNLRTKRYTESEIKQIEDSKNHVAMSFTLSDKFGEHGLVGVIVGELKNSTNLFIDTWLMSCRVLKRSMENFVLNKIIDKAKELGCKKIIGEYIPTLKNEIVANHYRDLGFSKVGDFWELEVEAYKNRDTYIN